MMRARGDRGIVSVLTSAVVPKIMSDAGVRSSTYDSVPSVIHAVPSWEYSMRPKSDLHTMTGLAAEIGAPVAVGHRPAMLARSVVFAADGTPLAARIISTIEARVAGLVPAAGVGR